MLNANRRRFVSVLAIGVLGLYAPIAASDERIYNAQLALRRSGYDPGPVDGIMGEQTRYAIRQFQRDNHLAITGDLNEATVKELRREARPKNPRADWRY